MVKFPSQNKMIYETAALGNDDWSAAGYLNLPKDLSVVNRRGYASTTRKGVPLVYRVRFTMSQHTLTGRASARNDNDAGSASVDTDTETAIAADNATLLKVLTVQNNWVVKNAAVKWHAAREKMMRDAGIPKKNRGAYAHEIRYNFDSASQTWMTPYDGDGAAFTGGTWDVSTLAFQGDKDVQLKLVGTAFTEDSALSSQSVQNMAYSYLASRATVPADSNLETNLVPADFSIMRELLSPMPPGDSADEIDAIAEGEGDNPPYHEFNASTVNHDITEPVEAGRVIAGPGVGVGQLICDIPFGLAELNARHSGATDQTIVDPVAFGVEILDIYPMQG